LDADLTGEKKGLVRDREKSLEKSEDLIKGVIKTIFF